jgi:NDP-sugar pyrophosphorylase family protein
MLPIAILAGGLATRLGALTQQTPKALLDIAGEPFIHRQLHLLKGKGFEKVVICIGYLGEQIMEDLGSGEKMGLDIRYSQDWPDLLGTGGALKKALPCLGEKFMVLYGDSYLDVDYQAIARHFEQSGQPALMTVYKNDDRFDVSNVVFEEGLVKVYDKENRRPDMDYIDYGLGVFNSEILATWAQERFDLATVYTHLVENHALAGYEVFERFYEIGSISGLDELRGIFHVDERGFESGRQSMLSPPIASLRGAK